MTERQKARLLVPLARRIREDRVAEGHRFGGKVDAWCDQHGNERFKGAYASAGDRGAFNYTADKVATARAVLRRAGVRDPQSLTLAESYLQAAFVLMDGGELRDGGPADRKARYRKGTGEGWCTVCCRNPVDGRKVCSPCNELAKERVRRSRERRRQTAA